MTTGPRRGDAPLARDHRRAHVGVGRNRRDDGRHFVALQSARLVELVDPPAKTRKPSGAASIEHDFDRRSSRHRRASAAPLSTSVPVRSARYASARYIAPVSR